MTSSLPMEAGNRLSTHTGATVRKDVFRFIILDSDTHFPETPREKYEGTLTFLGNRLPDREQRVEEFFLKPAENLPQEKFILGGSGWGDKAIPENIELFLKK